MANLSSEPDKHESNGSSSHVSSSSSSNANHRRCLLAAFTVLGTGLLAPSAAVMQSMDFLNAQYPDSHPAKLLSTCYNTAFLLACCGLFAAGRHGSSMAAGLRRMVAGYLIYTVALLLPVLVDGVMAWRAAPSSTWSLQRAGITTWAVSTTVLGAADAAISSVAYGQAASIGPRFTHAFLAGKATSGLAMTLLRCVAKASTPHRSLTGLRLSTQLFIAAAATLALLCALIVVFVLPRLARAIQQQQQLVLQVSGTQLLSGPQQRACCCCQPGCILPSNAGGAAASPSVSTEDEGASSAGSDDQLDAACIVEVQSWPQQRHQQQQKQQGGKQLAAEQLGAAEHGCCCCCCCCCQSKRPEDLQLDAPSCQSCQDCSCCCCSSSAQSPTSVASSCATSSKALLLDAAEEHQQQQHQKQRPGRGCGSQCCCSGGAIKKSSRRVARVCWPHLVAAAAPPLITAAVLPLILSSQVRQDQVLGDWTIQLTLLANQLGLFVGASLLPIPGRLRPPRATLLGAAAGMLAFVAAFAAMLQRQTSPGVLIPVAFVMYVCSGYIQATVFCLAPAAAGLAPVRDTELVQMLLVLVTAVSYAVGSGVSWSWLAHR